MTERNDSWFLFFGLNLGEEGGNWLGGFEDSKEETRLSSSWIWKIRMGFDSSKRFCFSIWIFNYLTSALSWFNPFPSKILSICFMRKGCTLDLITLSLSNEFLSL